VTSLVSLPASRSARTTVPPMNHPNLNLPVSLPLGLFNPKGWQTVAGGRSDSGDLRRLQENTSTPKAVPERSHVHLPNTRATAKENSMNRSLVAQSWTLLYRRIAFCRRHNMRSHSTASLSPYMRPG
jgi:hypothetical protein